RIARQADELAIEEEVVPAGRREDRSQPRGLAGSPRPEQEERAVWQREAPWIHRQQNNGKSAGGLCSVATSPGPSPAPRGAALRSPTTAPFDVSLCPMIHRRFLSADHESP